MTDVTGRASAACDRRRGARRRGSVGARILVECTPYASEWRRADGMRPDQRYELDAFGFCRLSSVLSASELLAAQQAASACSTAVETTAVAGIDPSLADPALERLATHPALLPLLLELCSGEPRLISGGLFGSDSDGSPHERSDGGTYRYTVEDQCCRCDALVVLCCLGDHEHGDGGLLVEIGSHKSQFQPPGSLGQEVSANLLNVCPHAGDFILLPEATRHIVLPRNKASKARHMLRLRFRSGAARGIPLPQQLRAIENQHCRLAAPTVALLRGDGNAIRALCPARLPEPEPPLHMCWSQGRNARTPASTGCDAAVTAEQRRLFDLHGFVHLWGVLSAEELLAARAAFERCRLASSPSRGVQAPSNVDGEPIREPAMEMLATHAAVLPLLMELGEGAPHLTGMALIYNQPQQGAHRMAGPYSELHCHGGISEHNGIVQDKRNNGAFGAKSGRITTDDWVVFPYLEQCDGGLGVVPASAKANFPRPCAVVWPYGSAPDGQAFGRDTVDGSTPTGPQSLLYTKADGLLQLTPDAGDFIVMSERCAHCILAWQPTDRPRVALTLRYFSGSAWARMQSNRAECG